MRLLVVLFFLALIGGVAAYFSGAISLPMNQPITAESGAQQAQALVSSLDSSLASQIRDWRENGWQPPEVLGTVSNGVSEASQATVSATFSATPEDVWRSFRDQGAQAALGTVVQSAEVSVNAVSQNVLNEARYQYCLGVVQARENQAQP